MYIPAKTGFLACGTAGKDGELTFAGENKIPKYSVSIAVGKQAGSTTTWVNCVAWRNIAHYAYDLDIRKGDTVDVKGEIKAREYKGKTYKDLVVESISVIHKDYKGKRELTAQQPPADFICDIENASDDDLPF